MSDAVRDVSLSEQLDPSTPEYVNARLMELGNWFEQAPFELERARKRASDAKEAYDLAKAHALVNSDAKYKEARDAQALIASSEEREAWQVADAALRFLQDKVANLGRQKDVLQTRSANLRSEMQLAGRGRP